MAADELKPTILVNKWTGLTMDGQPVHQLIGQGYNFKMVDGPKDQKQIKPSDIPVGAPTELPPKKKANIGSSMYSDIQANSEEDLQRVEDLLKQREEYKRRWMDMNSK